MKVEKKKNCLDCRKKSGVKEVEKKRKWHMKYRLLLSSEMSTWKKRVPKKMYVQNICRNTSFYVTKINDILEDKMCEYTVLREKAQQKKKKSPLI